MEVEIKKEESCTVVSVKGRLDTTNYLKLEKQLDNLIKEGTNCLVVDCVNLAYVSSSGLRVFLIALKELNKQNGKFVICNLQESIKEIFEISGFISIFDVYDNINSAKTSCV